MPRGSIKDISRLTGLSRATIDRALHGRAHVHPRTRAAVDAALRRLERPESAAAETVEADAILRLGRGMTAEVARARGVLGLDGVSLTDLEQADDAAMLAAVEGACADPARPLILTAKTSPALREVLHAARQRGKRVVTFISDQPADARDAFVGIDDRAAGQTAAQLAGLICGEGPARAGVVVGDSAFRCHEDREIGFRSHLRARFPRVTVTQAVKGEDSREHTLRAVRWLLRDHPDIAVIYNVAGGNAGLADALEEAGRDDVGVVAHEVNAVTRPLAQSGRIDFLISPDVEALLARAAALCSGPGRELNLVDFGVYTRFNLPAVR